MQPVVSHENSLEVSAPGPPIAVEMGALQPQDPSGPLEQNESGSHTQTNPQKASIGNPNVGGPSQSRSPDFSSSLPSEPVEQKLSVSARQSQDNLQGKGEIDTSRQFISPSEAEGSLSGSHEVATTNDAALLAVKIILLLPTGARHTLHVNDTYLRERKISVEARDPFLISVYTLKELILRDWQQEWSVKPSSPAAIRLIHFGRLLDDKQSLNECRFNVNAPNVVHMAVKPQDIIDEDDPKAAKGTNRDRGGDDRTVGCRCIVL